MEQLSSKRKRSIGFALAPLMLVAFLNASMPTVLAQTYSQSGGTNTLDNQTYEASGTDVSAVKVTGGTLYLSNSSCNSTSNTSSTDNSSFYGLNAVMLASRIIGSAVINSSNNKINSSGTGANGLFAYYSASITSSDDLLVQTGDGSHSIMCSGGGNVTVTNDSAITSGGSSSTIATDKGGGTIDVTGGSYTSNGNNSAAIYSTGTITCTDATLTANGAEALVVEGENKIILNNCMVKAKYDKWGALLYKSMSGDATGTLGYLTMTGGSFTYTGTKGGMFYNTNSTAIISLNGVTLVNSCDTLVRCIKGSWGGASATSGGITKLTADGQFLAGIIHADSSSKLYITLGNNSSFNGTINHSNTAKLATLTMDCSSEWTVTAASHINGLIINPCISGTTVSNITGNGYNVYYTRATNTALEGKAFALVNGGILLPEGSDGISEDRVAARSCLGQNFPNPVYESTSITYNVPNSAYVTLKIYNSLGIPIETLVDEPRLKGEYQVAWQPKVSAGYYFCQLTINGFSETKKIVVVK